MAEEQTQNGQAAGPEEVDIETAQAETSYYFQDTGEDEDVHRYVAINDPERNAAKGFCGNVVVTAKYNTFTFLPKFLFESFRKVANLYFGIVCILQTIKPISNTGGYPATLPTLMFIIAVDGVFALLEDSRRHEADKVANARPCQIMVPGKGEFVKKKWREVVVGDIVKVCNREAVPADMMILAVSEPPGVPPAGICYVETKSLDGETNLKLRQGVESTVNFIKSPEDLTKLRGYVKCELPNAAINKFTGNWCPEGAHPEPIGAKGVLLRDCVLRNTDWIYGLVLNTGHDSKIMMNALATPSKQSSSDKVINKLIAVLVLLLISTCLIGATLALLWNLDNSDAYYLDWEPENASEWVRMVFYFFLLNYQIIPVSLYVTMATVKFVQSYFLAMDVEMYHDETDTPARVRNMILNEELGQISYIFSDKTGTLTCNMMDFRKCSIGGKRYGNGTTEIGLASMKRQGKEIPKELLERKVPEDSIPYVNFDSPELFSDRDGASGAEQQERVRAFFTHLALCQTVIPEKVEGSDEVVYSASSPDEQALVAGAKYCGFEFTGRKPGIICCKILGEDKEFELLQVLEFNSTRKRMSALIRWPETNGVRLFCKGADTVILERLRDGDEEDKKAVKTVEDDMEFFADEGLRTLALAYVDIDEKFYTDWAERYTDAISNLEEIEKRKNDEPNLIDQCMEEVEKDLILLGATAIEDKLQDGVPETIAKLAEGGIKIWVLTGDKQETAINISFACQLLTNDMEQVIVNLKKYRTKNQMVKMLNERARVMKECFEKPGAAENLDYDPFQVALVIDGECLGILLEGESKLNLLNFAQYCRAVVACRVSPAQKAEIVNLVKDNMPGARTLAVGDGANDVGMIQQAHCGIGISGHEGMQAVNSSDYAIAQFRFLQRLVLVHGRWNYVRMSTTVCYMFYKNILLVLAQYWYTFYTGFSGTKYYNELGIQLYNIIYTAIPIVFLGVYDQDINARLSLKFPKLYYPGIIGKYLNFRVFGVWLWAALMESIVICLMTVYAYTQTAPKGTDMYMYGIGLTVFTLVVFVTNGKLALIQKSWWWLIWVGYLIAVGGWIVSAFLVSYSNLLGGTDYAGMFPGIISTPTFWLLVFVVMTMTNGFDLAVRAVHIMWRPEYRDIVYETQVMKLDESGAEWPEGAPPQRFFHFVPPPLAVEDLDEKDRDVAGEAVTEEPINKLRIAARAVIGAGRLRSVSRGYAFSNDQDTTMAEAHMVSRLYSTQSLRGVLAQSDEDRGSNASSIRSMSSRRSSLSEVPVGALETLENGAGDGKSAQ